MGKFPVIRDLKLGFEAYERYQLAAYFSEIIEIRKNPEFVESRKLFPQVAKLIQAMSAVEFFELGSTLFASIDKVAKCVGNQQSQSINYYGVEPSKLLREAAEIIHPNHHIIHYNSSELAHFPDVDKSVHRSYQASSYAFCSVSELVNWVSRFGATQDGIWFSTDDRDGTAYFLGSRVTTFSFSQFCKAMKNEGFNIQVLTAQEVKHFGFAFIEVFCTCYRKDIVDLMHIDGDNQLPCDFEQSIATIADIPKDCWLEARTVPVTTTSISNAIAYGRVLNFAGCHREVFS